MRVDFYHLQLSTMDQALPLLLERAYKSQARILIKVSTKEQAEQINTLLWTFAPEKWLPHGAENDGYANQQPIFITSNEDNPNNAKIIVLLEGGTFDEIKHFDRCLTLFNGSDEAQIISARALWKQAVTEDCEAFYWQQNQNGQWEQKASNKNQAQSD